MKEEFLRLLRTVNREGIEELINFLEKSDFFKAPASTRFHGDHEGGLVEHSLKVYEILKHKVELIEEKNKLEWIEISKKLLDNEKFAGNYNIPHIIKQIKELRDKVYNKMCYRSKNTDIEYYKYIKDEKND